jgi:hypothetical protein
MKWILVALAIMMACATNPVGPDPVPDPVTHAEAYPPVHTLRVDIYDYKPWEPPFSSPSSYTMTVDYIQGEYIYSVQDLWGVTQHGTWEGNVPWGVWEIWITPDYQQVACELWVTIDNELVYYEFIHHGEFKDIFLTYEVPQW